MNKKEMIQEILLRHEEFNKSPKMLKKMIGFISFVGHCEYLQKKAAIDRKTTCPEFVNIHNAAKYKYIGDGYGRYICIALDEGILKCDNTYFKKSFNGIGKSLGYKINDIYLENVCLCLIKEIKAYKRKKKIRKSIKKTLCHAHSEKLHDNISFDINKVVIFLNSSGWTVHKKLYVYRNLLRILKLKYTASNSESNGRMHSMANSFPKEIRNMFVIKKKKASHIIDIASCHPQMWGMYINTLVKNIKIRNEYEEWTSFWSNPEIDSPRDDLIRLFFNPSASSIKKEFKFMMNSYFNGRYHKRFGNRFFAHKRMDDIPFRFTRYLLNYFPEMYAIWTKSNIKRTGCEISKLFEVPIMQCDSVYEYCNENKIWFNLEHDGGTLYGASDAQAKHVLQLFIDESKIVTGFYLKFKMEKVNDSVQ